MGVLMGTAQGLSGKKSLLENGSRFVLKNLKWVCYDPWISLWHHAQESPGPKESGQGTHLSLEHCLKNLQLLPVGRVSWPAPQAGQPSFAPRVIWGVSDGIFPGERYPGGSASPPSRRDALSRRRRLSGAGPWRRALPLLQPPQQEQHVVAELVPLPPHPT